MAGLPENLSLGEMMELVKQLFEHPSVKKLLEIDAWAKEQGLPKRDEFNRVLADLFMAAPSPDIAKQYVTRMLEVFVELGPTLMSQLRQLGK